MQALRLLTLLPCLLVSDLSRAQKLALLAPAPQPEIASAVGQVDAGNLETIVRKLAGFGTRHTFSDTTSETRGIGAARRWLKSRLLEISKETGGRLQVALEEYPIPRGSRRRRVPELSLIHI